MEQPIVEPQNPPSEERIETELVLDDSQLYNQIPCTWFSEQSLNLDLNLLMHQPRRLFAAEMIQATLYSSGSICQLPMVDAASKVLYVSLNSTKC